MKTRLYLSWTCAVALLGAFAQSPFVAAADAGWVKSTPHASSGTGSAHTTGAGSPHAPTGTGSAHTTTTATETWQSLMVKAKKNFHITDEEIEAEAKEDEIAKRMHKHLPKHPFPNASPAEMKTGREELTESLRLAQQHIKPLEGLKVKETAYDLMSLVTCVGFVNSVDAIAVATLFHDYQEGHDVHQQLVILRKTQSIAKRVEAQTMMAADLVKTAFGTKDEKVEFKDEYFKSSGPLHVFVSELQKCADQVHKNSVDLDAAVVKLEKEAISTTVNK